MSGIKDTLEKRRENITMPKRKRKGVKIYMESKLLLGDCKDKLKELDDNSVDLMATDPPYGLSFMGKEWDSFNEVENIERDMPNTVYAKKGFKKLPRNKPIAMEEFFVPIWKECLRVLKPGGFAFIMAAPKQDVLQKQIEAMDMAGFKTNFTSIYWAYATGFPKAMNIGKAVDKRLGKERSDEAKSLDGSYAGYQPKPAVEVVIVAMKPLEKKGYLDQALDNGKGVTWLDDCRIPFAGMNDEEQFDKDNVAGHQKFIEKRKEEMYGGGWEKPARKSKSDYEKYVSDKNNKENYSDERGWDKWGVEEEDDTYERVSAFGDSSQSETKDGRNLWGKKATKKVKITKRQPRSDHNVFKQSGFKSEENDTAEASPLGRFAANLLVSDNILDTGKKTKSSGGRIEKKTGWGEFGGGEKEVIEGQPGKGDVGDFSRYYSLDEWWKFRMSRLPEEIQRTFPFLVVPKASKSEKNMGLENLEKQQKIYNGQSPEPSKDMKGVEKKFTTQPSQNFHPTVKPVDLMSYLVVLGSRKDDVVLDPFAGSGTTGIACVFSERNYILIEREKEYYDIMEARIKKAKNPADLVQHEWF